MYKEETCNCECAMEIASNQNYDELWKEIVDLIKKSLCDADSNLTEEEKAKVEVFAKTGAEYILKANTSSDKESKEKYEMLSKDCMTGILSIVSQQASKDISIMLNLITKIINILIEKGISIASALLK